MENSNASANNPEDLVTVENSTGFLTNETRVGLGAYYRNNTPDEIANYNTHGSINSPMFNCVRLSPNALIPTKGSRTAAGFDLYALDKGGIAPRARLLVPTGIAVAIPRTWYGRIAPRSGLAHNHGIDVLAGVIDSDYRGEIKVILQNNGSGDFKFEPGDKIAQLVLEKCGEWQIQEVQSLDSTQRGEGGFGSTGK